MTEKRQASVRRLRPKLSQRAKLEVPAASGIVMVGNRFLVADDESGIYLAATDGSSKLVVPNDRTIGLTDLEGICLSVEGDRAFVLSERSRRVFALSVREVGDELELGRPEPMGRLPRAGTTRNNGWEGIEVLPPEPAHGAQSWLVAVHEKNPRRVCFQPIGGLAVGPELKLPSAAKERMSDLADVAACPSTGRLLLLSDESRSLVEVEVRALGAATELAVTGHGKLRGIGKEEQAEGICFDGDGRLWLVTDGNAHLYCFDLETGS